MEERGMNERVRMLRRQSVETQPHIYMERAKLMTEAYKLYDGSMSVPEMRATALKYYFQHKTIEIADVYGPTGVINSCAKMDQLSTGGTLLNQKFTPSVLAGDTGLDQFANLIRAYFNMDGHHIQFNVIDRKTLLAAQANPEEYKDLIVRVAGYSDHFRNLSKELQDEIINRTEQSFDDYSDADSEYPKGGCGC